jgi:hypothetical protein
MTRNDRDALRRALMAARAESPSRARQIDEKLKTESWVKVAEFAAFCAQCRALQLKPWQCPPCDSDDEIDGRYGGKPAEVSLRRKMLALRLSPFEPDPLAAIERAEAEVAAKAAQPDPARLAKEAAPLR